MSKKIKVDKYLNEFFSAASEEKVKSEKKRKKDKMDGAAKAFESFIFGEEGLDLKTLGIDVTEKEQLPEPVQSVGEKPTVSEQVKPTKEKVEGKLPKIPKLGEPGAFLRESSKVDRNSEATISNSVKFLDSVTSSDGSGPKKLKEETELGSLKQEVARLKSAILEISRAAAAQGGGGEVNLLRLDDFDGDDFDKTIDGQTIVWSVSEQKFVSSSTRGVDDPTIEGVGGYEFTGGFSDRLSGQSGANDFGTLVSYTQTMADNDTWMRFGFSESARDANDVAYFPTGSNYDSTKGLFGGEHLPAGVDGLIDFSDSTAYNNAVTSGDLQYTAAGGSLDFTTCRVGDLALVRFDFNIVPQVANTTIEIAMIWQTRDSNDNATLTFALTGEPIFYGTGTVGKTFLNRPMLSAYFASAEDVNARALLAVRADNPVQIAPLTTLVTIQR